MTIHTLLTSTSFDLAICFMDDVALEEHEDTVERDVEVVRANGAEIGSQVNVQNCELISANSSHPNATSLKDFVQMEPINYCHLCAPFLPGNAIYNALDRKSVV